MTRAEKEREKKRQAEQEKLLRQLQLLIFNVYLQGLTMAGVKRAIAQGNDRFYFSQNATANASMNRELSRMAKQMDALLLNGIERSWKQGEEDIWDQMQLLFSKDARRRKAIDQLRIHAAEAHRKNAAQAFYNEKRNGLSISDRVWNLSKNAKKEMEVIIQNGIKEGKSAEEIQQSIRGYLKEPDKLFRRVRNKETWELEWSDAAKRYKPGQGVYRSAYKNAMRLARTEINAAYRQAQWEQYQNDPTVVGIRIELSNNHTTLVNGVPVPFYDICDELRGVYPKTFKWTGWHPQCYSDDSLVLTTRGWLLFDDVRDDDLIFSLNPATRQPEWVGIVAKQKYYRKGEMVHFHNRSLDCLVTPDHEMVYLSKAKGDIKKKPAEDYSKNNGGFYRGCEWSGKSSTHIAIGKHRFNMIDFAEFMGYWLSDGSLIRDSQIKIAQQDGNPNKAKIEECCNNLGLKPGGTSGSVDVYSKDLNEYLKQFGTCERKYIPNEIKNADRIVISTFLNAFISCDGHERKPKPFMGNRGKMCYPKQGEREFFTTSHQLAADIGELLLKVGKRPSYSIDYSKGKPHQFRNGEYIINYDLYRIRECNATTATVFHKEYKEYDGFVYDLTLERNHIMYIQRNGKCFWGSNCRCQMHPVLMSDDEYRKLVAAENEGKQYTPRQITKMPKAFDEWVKKNESRAKGWASLPRFIRDNMPLVKGWEDLRPEGMRVDDASTTNVVDAGIKSKLEKAKTPLEKKSYVSFEPFSPVIIEQLKKLKHRREINALFRDILTDDRTKLLYENENKKAIATLYPNHRGIKSKHWNETKGMSKYLVDYGTSSSFLPEYDDKTSADAITQFKKRWVIADFKYSTTTQIGTLKKDLVRGFGQADCIVLQIENGNTDLFVRTIEELKRKDTHIKDIILINRYGKVIEIDNKSLMDKSYVNKIRGHL